MSGATASKRTSGTEASSEMRNRLRHILLSASCTRYGDRRGGWQFADETALPSIGFLYTQVARRKPVIGRDAGEVRSRSGADQWVSGVSVRRSNLEKDGRVRIFHEAAALQGTLQKSVYLARRA